MSVQFPAGPKVTDRKLYDSWIRGRFEPNLRVLRGRIDTTTPTILSGVGFTIVKNAVGDVTFTFDPPYSDIPSVTATTEDSAAPNVYITFITGNPTASTVRIVRHQINVGNTDGKFGFVAIGPS